MKRQFIVLLLYANCPLLLKSLYRRCPMVQMNLNHKKMSKTISNTNKADHGKCHKRNLTEWKIRGREGKCVSGNFERPLVKLGNFSEGKEIRYKTQYLHLLNVDKREKPGSLKFKSFQRIYVMRNKFSLEKRWLGIFWMF